MKKNNNYLRSNRMNKIKIFLSFNMFSFNLFTYEIKTNLDIINVVKRHIEPIEYISSVLLLMEFF